MTASRLAAKLRKLREEHEDAEMENGELNLVPYLDIVTNIVMFLLATMTAYAATLKDINVSVPTVSPQPDVAAAAPQDKNNPDLNLTVSISEKGFTIGASGGFVYNQAHNPPDLPSIPKDAQGKYNYDALTKKLEEIKKDPLNRAENETKVIINADANITYETVVATMDAARGKIISKPDPQHAGKTLAIAELFGDVLLSAGVN